MKQSFSLENMSLDEKFDSPGFHLYTKCRDMAFRLSKGMDDIGRRAAFITSEELIKIQHRWELEILNSVRANHHWDRTEHRETLPVKISLSIIYGRPHLDLSGPIAAILGHFMIEFQNSLDEVDPKDPESRKGYIETEEGEFVYDI